VAKCTKFFTYSNHIQQLIFYGRVTQTKICSICALITGQNQILHNSAKTQKIPGTQANSAVWLEILNSAENCGA